MFVAPDNYLAIGALYFLNSSYWRRVTCGVLALSGGYDFPSTGLYEVLYGRILMFLGLLGIRLLLMLVSLGS